MPAEKLTYEEFLSGAESKDQTFIQTLHAELLEKGCKGSYEKKKTSLLASYKLGKPPKALLNLLIKKQGLFVRIYGENAWNYQDFLQTIPGEMVQSIAKGGDCGRLIKNTCSMKCSGYDVTIGNQRFQKCRYSGFEFLVTEESGGSIKAFVEHELEKRTAP